MARRGPIGIDRLSTSSSSSSSDSALLSSAENNNKVEVQHQKIMSQISGIHSESGEAGLLRTLQALVTSVRETRNNDDTKKNFKSILRKALGVATSSDSLISHEGNPFESTPSHEGGKIAWTADAIIKNLEAITGLTPVNVKAIKEMLGLPIGQQYRLIQAIIER